MGLSFHYSGSITSVNQIPSLVEEVTEVCDIFSWKYHHLNDDLLDGIVFSPLECEPVFLTFLKSGQLCNPVYIELNITPYTTVSVKTQYAGIEVHRALIKLLKHLSKKYFSSFEVSDEGMYWDDLDEEKLRTQFARYNMFTELVIDSLQSFKPDDVSSPEGLVESLERFFQERFPDSDARSIDSGS